MFCAVERDKWPRMHYEYVWLGWCNVCACSAEYLTQNYMHVLPDYAYLSAQDIHKCMVECNERNVLPRISLNKKDSRKKKGLGIN